MQDGGEGHCHKRASVLNPEIIECRQQPDRLRGGHSQIIQELRALGQDIYQVRARRPPEALDYFHGRLGPHARQQ
ncbi:MAG: hypothetical protein LC749_17325 [Actinobacteria bacterium]|nr:hypothetical protein [Actinomycetota bacterium]